jgi:ubiquinone/menaquinone biosynthesis C-methylase UbiE
MRTKPTNCCHWALLLLLAFPLGLFAQDSPAQKADDAATKSTNASKPKSKRMRRPPTDPHKPWGQGVVDGTYMGRGLAPVMSYLGAEWLVRPEREEEEEPERMLDALDIKPGMTVADVGAGVGYTSMRIARRVGQNGHVLATDIQPEMIRKLKQNAKSMQKDKIITPILCTADDPKLPAGEVDLAIMVDVYHECTHPVETLRGIRKALKPQGRLVLIEFRAEDPEVPILPEHKMTAAQAQREVEPQGFRLAKRHDFLPWQHILVFEKTPDAQDSKQPLSTDAPKQDQ